MAADLESQKIAGLLDGQRPVSNQFAAASRGAFDYRSAPGWHSCSERTGSAAFQDRAHANATLYSLIASVKPNGHDPYWYLRHLFDRLPHATESKDYCALLPHRLRPEDLPA